MARERLATSRHPTSSDVARAAGVSQAAVSMVLSGKARGRVAPETCAAILQAAAKLGYLPNAAARALRAGRAWTLALVATDVHHPFFASVLDGAEVAARSLGYAMILINMREGESNWKSVIARALASHAVDGFLLFAHYDSGEADVEALGRKAVLIESQPASVPTLQLDIAGGFSAALGHLLELGHTRIAHLAADYASETFRVQHRMYAQELSRQGLEQSEARARFSLADAIRAADELLDRVPRPTALVCDDDVLAPGVYKAARKRGLRIPDQLSVTGFGDIELARVLEPELTTVQIPAEAVGAEAVRLLVNWVEHERQPELAPLVDLPLIVRRSTARPAAQPRTLR